tara:strand:+ start:330 stop:1985 length:1656 start_codon:yes stop_codon:yes gene_type:complete
MAIREFGGSLLADVRARKDQQGSDQRKRNRRAERDQLKNAAGVWLGKQALGLVQGSLERKSDAFFKNSTAYDTKVKLGQAETYINEYDAFKDLSKKNDTSFGDEVLKDTAAKQVIQYGLANANAVTTKNTPALTAYFMRQEDVKKLAADRASFFTDVGAFKTDFVKGKNQTPVQSLINKRKPKNVLSYLARSLTGKLSSAEAFNAEIDELIQVKAANGILTRKEEAMKDAVINGAVTPDEARVFMPELEEIQKDSKYNKSIRLLDTTTIMGSQTGIHFEGGKVWRKELSQVKDYRNNIVSTGFEFKEIKDIDLTKPLTPDDIVKMSGEVSDLSEHASKILNAQGFNDYSKEAAALLRTFDGKIGTEYLLAASSLLNSQKFTDPKNYKLDVSPEKLKQLYFLEEEIIKATSSNLVNLTGRKNTTELLIKKWKRENPTLSLENDRKDLVKQLEDDQLNLNAVVTQRREQIEQVRASYFETTTVTPKTSVDLTSTEWATSKNWAVEEDEDGTRRLINRDNDEFIYFIRGTNKVQDVNGLIRNFTAKEELGVPTT